MPFKIWIGVDNMGVPLVGAVACNAAADRGELHDTEHVFPSQLRYRVAVFYPESGSTYRGVEPLRELGKTRRVLPGRWRIRTRTQAADDIIKCVTARGVGCPAHEFPIADGSRTTRRKVSP
jgi:hypothetical protein